MSNQAVGHVYQSIIEEVINSSRVDFEESGVDDSVLEELRKGWQQKLTQLDVARFPWDPKPDPPPTASSVPAAPAAPAAASTVPAAPSQNHSQVHYSPDLPLPNVGEVPLQNGIKMEPGLVKAEPTVKQEPDSQPHLMQQFATYNGMENKNSVAANRAAQQLQMQYGNRAAGSINAIQGMGQQQQPSGQQAGDATAHMQEPHGPDAVNHMDNGQTDGAADNDDGIEGFLFRRAAGGPAHELGRVEIDRMLHDQIAARAKAMEGGGLMIPLEEAHRRRAAGKARDVVKGKGKSIAAFDGGGDDDEDDVDDEDAINSDLDDPEEDRDDDEVDDEGLGHIMLCMYDKVQRVKNKWKCTLKDGVLTVNGKEYVFHKATGEYEW
ncbi:Transcription factor IIA, alpha/beta subunit [Ophiocordyceps camponoti-floridani]|uniref:Transcription initiation factor IIA large subunit n=1 Tax=Ophiocordyceps camponoti-floridani TaxID=2030778 RepID=A0A8H4QA59_9HYPO|nr:Transcription factor IIA, alpha/beta subunit [Ophiocordyceps camponoti-floridani]